MVSIRPVVISVIFVKARLTPFLSAVPPGNCCICDFLYEHTRSIRTASHGFSSAIISGGKYPYRLLRFLNC